MDKLAAYYAQRAAEYERIFAKPERQADLAALKARVRKMFTNRKVLELACGTGFQTRTLEDGSTHEVPKNFPAEGELIRRSSRRGWGAHVELLEHYWLLTYWAPK